MTSSQPSSSGSITSSSITSRSVTSRSITSRPSAIGNPACRRRGQRSLEQRRRDERINQYRQLVEPIARHYQRRCAEPLDDLVQVGLLGLLRATELYRSAQHTPFEAFARPHVRGAILHYLRDQAALVRLPRRLQEQRQQLARLQQLHPELSRPEQWRQAMGLNMEQWNRLRAAGLTRRPLTLEPAMEDQLAQPDPSGAAEVATSEWGGLNGSTNPLQLLATLAADQRVVVERVVLAGWSYRRTGAALQISPMTVQRRLQRGLGQLRNRLSQASGACPAPSGAPGC